MPRQSNRRRTLRRYEKLLEKQNETTLFRMAMDDDDNDDDSTGSLLLESLELLQQQLDYEKVQRARYVSPRNLYRSGAYSGVFNRDMTDVNNADGTPPWLSSDEFLQKYRVHRESFSSIIKEIEQHLVFHSGIIRRPQRPCAHQMMVLLHYLGTSGSGANNPRVRNVFGIGRGTAELYKRRCVTALRSLKDATIYWPDDGEKREIARRIFQSSDGDWINCIGVADGTLVPLTFAPQSEDAPDYHGGKHPYSMSVMIVNDDKKRVRMFHAGNPGCAHDSRVYSQMPLSTNPTLYFRNHHYFLLGDSDFTNSSTMVASFKAPRGHSLSKDQEAFNTSLGRVRVSSEHTIGMLKARFPILRSLPMQITNKADSVRRIIRIIECCIILHNLLISMNDDIPNEWYDDDEGDDDSDIANTIGEYAFSDAFLDHHANDERRGRCFDYLKGMGSLN